MLTQGKKSNCWSIIIKITSKKGYHNFNTSICSIEGHPNITDFLKNYMQ